MEEKTSLTVTSPAFEQEGLIPVQNTGYGEDVSPELHLSGIAEGAKSIAIIMDDLDHPIKPGVNHWIIWNIPVMEVIPGHIPPGGQVAVPVGAVQGRGYGRNRYRGPKPPFNWSHRYQYNVYVLDATINLNSNARRAQLLSAMEGHILQHGFLVGRYR